MSRRFPSSRSRRACAISSRWRGNKWQRVTGTSASAFIVPQPDPSRAGVDRWLLGPALTHEVICALPAAFPALPSGQMVIESFDGAPNIRREGSEKLPIFWHPKERPPLREIYQGVIKLRADY